MRLLVFYLTAGVIEGRTSNQVIYTVVGYEIEYYFVPKGSDIVDV